MRRWIALASIVLLPVPAAAQEAPLPPIEAVAELLQSGRVEQAERELRRIVERSESAAARDLLGIALTRLGRLEEAATQFSRAALLAPDVAAPRQHLARLFLQQGRNDEALTELRTAARLGPLERDLALWLADVDLSLGNTARAEALLRSVVERHQSVRALLTLARLYGRQGMNPRAAELVQQALEIAPNSEEVLAAWARVSLAVETPVVAIRALESLIRMHPTAEEYNYLLGLALLQIGEMASSVEALRRSLELEPDRPSALIALCTTLNAQKRYDEGREVARRAVHLDPENAEALAVFAESEEGLGNIGPAETYANQALAREPENARALEVTGRIRMAQGRYEEARDALLRATVSLPGSAKTHYQLSQAYARLGDRENSRKHVEIYRRLKDEYDERLVELRARAGLGESGMGRS